MPNNLSPARTAERPVKRILKRHRWRIFSFCCGFALLVVLIFVSALLEPLLVYVGVILKMEESLLHRGPSGNRLHATTKQIRIVSADGYRLSGSWLVCNAGGIPPDQLPTLFVFYGNAQNVADSGPFVDSLLPIFRSCNVLRYTYRGYSGAPARNIGERHYKQDVLAALDYALRVEGVNPDRIVAIGQSLGGAMALFMAASYPRLHTLVLINTFTSIRSVVLQSVPWFLRAAALLIGNNWDCREQIERIRSEGGRSMRVYLMKSTRDHLFGDHQMDRLAQRFALVKESLETLCLASFSDSTHLLDAVTRQARWTFRRIASTLNN